MKKKFYGLLAIFLLVLSLGLFTTSYAYTFDEFLEFTQQIKNANISNVFNHHANLILTYQDNLRSAIGNNNYVSWVVKTQNTSTGYCTILVYDSSTSISVVSNNNGTIYPTNKYPTTSFLINQSNGNVSVSSPSSENYFNSASYFGLIETDSIITNWYQLKFNNFYTPAPKINFTPGNDGIITVGNYSNVNLVYWWPTIYVTWGIISGYNEISPSLLNYALIRVYPNGDEEVVINPFVEPWYLLSLGEYYWESPQRRIFTNSLYKLLIDYDGDVQTFYFYVVPRNSNIATGSTIPFNWNSGDSNYTTQNQTNDLINEATDLSSIDNTKEALLESGELVKRLNYQEYPNHSYEILFALTRNLCDTLYYSGDTYIDVSIGDWYTHRFYASDFYIPVNGLTYWIYMALIFGYCYLLYRQASELIHAIQEGDLYVLELEDADEYFYM